MRLREVLKQATFALLPSLLLVAGLEGAVRLAGLDRPSLAAGGFGRIGLGSFIRADPLLGWSLEPGYRGLSEGRPVSLNSEGLRAPEIPPKGADEYRILSLGESTTFGVGVGDGETYSARLEEYLRERFPGREIRVINAGVSAYSSTQSLLWLEHRGLRLRPDLILLYHEINDYLPATIRDTELTEADLLKTDRRLYSSKVERLGRSLAARSALYRALSYGWARHRIVRLDPSDLTARAEANPLAEIGLPETVAFRVAGVRRRGGGGKEEVAGEIVPELLGRRVSEAERRGNLEELAALCRRKGIDLVVIHPSYRISKPHSCLLTRFCRDKSVPLFESYPFLHLKGAPEELFADGLHPTAEGHDRLARGLADFLAGGISSGKTGYSSVPR
jgi:lysophospholipase L1-like esterase